jgi:cell division protein FtsX
MDHSVNRKRVSQAIGTQIQLPFSKAVEISLKSIKIRFARSFITGLGIVLAITFFMATLTRGKTVESLKSGIPSKIHDEQNKLSAKAELRKKIAALCEAGKPLDKSANGKKILTALDQSEITGAMNLLQDELDARPALASEPEVKAVAADLEKLSNQAVYVKSLRNIRQELLRQGETLANADASEAISATAIKEKNDAQSRDRWLMVMALLVSLVGITNAMLMSVTERFREIGTMKCLGALDTFIMKLFLIESSLQGFIGTAAGVIFGLLLCLLKLTFEFGFSMWSFLPWSEIGYWGLVALGVGTVLSVLGALYPAWLAAKMEPVVAMRQDQ